MPEHVPDMGWWTIHGQDLMNMLREVEAGESPDVVYAQRYADSEHEHP